MHIQLAQDDSSSLSKSLHNRSVFLRNPILKQSARRGCPHARCVDQILQAYGNAVQRAAPLPSLYFGLGPAGLCQCRLCRNGDEGVEQRIESFCAGKACPICTPRCFTSWGSIMLDSTIPIMDPKETPTETRVNKAKVVESLLQAPLPQG